MPEPDFQQEMVYQSISPIVVAKKMDNNSAKYLTPEDDDFERIFTQNLIHKYLSESEKIPLAELKFELIGDFRKKGILIKANTPQQTKVIGYIFRFKLSAPPELQRVGFHAGFGEKNAQGFGCVKVVEE